MGKLFTCEYCGKSFKDVIEVRRSHLNSVRHQEARSLYYSQFKDPLTQIQEAATKVPCKWFERGICKYGDKCQSSHMTKSQLEQLKLQGIVILIISFVTAFVFTVLYNYSSPEQLPWKEGDFQNFVDEWIIKNMPFALNHWNFASSLTPSLKMVNVQNDQSNIKVG